MKNVAVHVVILLGVGAAIYAAACSAGEGNGSPRETFPVTLVEVEFLDGQTRLAGTLYQPESDSPRPGLVVLGGSDRGPRGRMKDNLARAFSENGIAVLTYDSPGTGRSGGNALFQTRRGRAREAISALQFLRSSDGIDAEHVGLCGGSEGAFVALLGAGMDPDVDFAIAVSGAFGMSSMDISRYRIEAMGLRRGLSDGEVRRAMVLEELLYALVTGLDVVEWRLLLQQADPWEGEPWAELIDIVSRSRQELSNEEKDAMWTSLRGILRDWMKEPWFELAVVDRANLERVLAMDTRTFFAFLARGPLAAGDWYRGREELELLAGVQCPVLAVWGEEDDFLPPHRSAAWLGAVLSDAGNTDVTLRVLPGAGHSLTRADAPDTYAAGYPQMLVDWLKRAR